MPRWLRYSFLAALLLCGMVLIFIAAGGASASLFNRYFPVLLAVDLAVTLVLLGIVATISFRLVRNWRRKVFGSRMTLKLAVTVAVISALPCLFIYLVSSQFIGRTIDSWFDVSVEHALESGVGLSGEMIGREQERLLASARHIVPDISAAPQGELAGELKRLSAEGDFDLAVLFDAEGRILSSHRREGVKVLVDMPGDPEFRQADEDGSLSSLEGEGAEGREQLRVRALLPLKEAKSSARWLQCTRLVPETLSETASDLVNGYREYQELILTRGALQNIYRVSLTLTLLMGVFAAIAAALSFARVTTAPVRQLALGTRKVAGGDLQPIREFPGNDEINALTQSFNSMISQIAEARKNELQQSLRVERARAYLERVLENLSSGVIVVDGDMNVVLANAAAGSLLKPAVVAAGRPLAECDPELAAAAAGEIRVTEGRDFHTELEIPREEKTLTFFLRGSRIALEQGHRGWVMVFDDMSAVIDAQRAIAWGEVARRLAHEIKNPLTPIRLAAERLEIKLAGKLGERDEALLHRTTGTIITQVDAMKKMVDDFRELAKLPSARLKPVDLNGLLHDFLGLYSTAGKSILTDLAPGLPEISADAAQLNQVLHNLVGNAVDATAETAEPAIRISTSALPGAVRLVLEDNGPGFQEKILSKAFEPYITTKPTGTGLGLPMVKKIIEEHHARITIGNRRGEDGAALGAQVVIVFPAAAS